jgi:hypothetical protein
MVFIKDVAGNLDPGDATHWGGNDINVIDDYFDNVDISPKAPRINTITRFRDQKFYLLDSDASHAYIFQTGNLTADRKIILPVLTADDTPLFVNFAATLFNKTLDPTTTVFPTNITKNDTASTFTASKSHDEEIFMKKQTTYATPASSYVALYFDNVDGMLKKKDSAGVITNIEGGTNPIFPDNTKKLGTIVIPATGSPDHFGLLDNGTDTGTRTLGDNSTDGNYIQWASAGANNDNAGYHIPATFIYRKFNPDLYCRFQVPDMISTSKLFIGFNSNTTIPGGNDELNAQSGIMLYKTNGGNFRIGYNDGTGVTVFTSDLATQDTNTHTIRIRAVDSLSKWQYSWDNGAFVDLTTDIPAQTTALSVVFNVEAGAAVVTTLRIFDGKLQSDK